MKEIVVLSPLSGEVVQLKKVKDKVFSGEVLGEGIAIIPDQGTVVSPVSGTIDAVASAKHAINVVGDSGEELLIHIGLDTVTLKGSAFTPLVKAGDKVKQGDVLMEFDLQGIKGAGLDTVSPVVVLNTADYRKVEGVSGRVKQGAPLLTIKA
ncbi:MAG: PTS glucose transporter subunit IIA [Treponema sp.]|jgi:PTS system beta-glucosides-specific IIC component|nr:PTS glucose transporter subunit IIA [Treponema sp.]